MGAAILQGVPATTLDTDIWVDLNQNSQCSLAPKTDTGPRSRL